MPESKPVQAPPAEMLSRRALPEPATPLVGRAPDVVFATRALTSGPVRLLTLTGPGGVGKTHLALEIGRTLVSDFAHGVCWVDLAALSDAQLVLPTLARALGLTDPGQIPVREQVQRFLQPRHVLLVLDNFEHVLDAAADIGYLLSVCPAVRILATSREPLHLSWEHEQPVAPLPVPPRTASVDPGQLRTNPAVALFVSRAQAVRPDFDLEPSNCEAVADLCRSLDGLPLALELAAARVKALPPAVLLTRLERRLDVLATPQRDRPARQQALRSAIGWSYDLLNPAEQSLFRHLAVFSDGCSLDAAETVANGSLDTVASLIDKNLLRFQEHGVRGAGPRVKMLESVRAYGMEQLVVYGEFHVAHRQMAALCVPLVQDFEQEWRGPNPQLWLQRVDVELDNLRTALRWSTSEGGDAETGVQLAGGLWWFWVLRGYLTEGRAWLARALASPGVAAPTAARANALNAAGYLATMHGETAAARAPLEQSLALHRQLGDERGIALSLLGLGFAAYHGDDPSGARGYLEDSLAHAAQASDRVTQHLVLVILGQVARRQGDPGRAVDLNEQCLAIRRELGDLWGVGKALLNLGMLSRVQGDLIGAHSQLAEGLALFQQFDDPRSCALTLSELCAVAAEQHQAERAARLLGAAEALIERLGMRWTPERGRINAQSFSTVCGLVGDAAAATSLAVGRALPLEDAITEALANAPGAFAAHGPTDASDEDELTGREREVLVLLVRGLTSREIADELVVSVRTVEHHRAQISAKVGARGRAGLVAYARRRGLSGR